MNRTTTKAVRFARPFVLPGIDGEQPPGIYEIEVEEEALPGLSFPAYRRVETRITLPFTTMGASGYQTVPVSQEALEAALARDTEPVR
jgi:hypothetical protein